MFDQFWPTSANFPLWVWHWSYAYDLLNMCYTHSWPQQSNLLQKVHSQMTNLWLRLDQVFLVKVLSVIKTVYTIIRDKSIYWINSQLICTKWPFLGEGHHLNTWWNSGSTRFLSPLSVTWRQTLSIDRDNSVNITVNIFCELALDWYSLRSGTLHSQPISNQYISDLLHGWAVRHQTVCCPGPLLSCRSAECALGSMYVSDILYQCW